MNKNFAGCLCAAMCEVLFGFSYLFTKWATGSVSTFTLLAWRFVIAFLVMRLLIRLGVVTVNIRKKGLLPLLMIALFQPVIYFVAETFGINATTASESGAILACIPVASIMASALFLHKKPRRIQVAGILVTLSGVLCCVLTKGFSASFSGFGYGMLFLAVISYSLYCVLVDANKRYSSLEKTYIMIVCGAVVFSVIAVMHGIENGTILHVLTLPFVNRGFLMAVLYQGIGCSVLAFFMSNKAIEMIGTNRAASFVGLSTAVSIAAGILILKESFSVIQIIGTVLIVGGVYLANSRKGPGFNSNWRIVKRAMSKKG